MSFGMNIVAKSDEWQYPIWAIILILS